MKQTMILLLALAMLLSVAPAKANSGPAYFASYTDKPGTLQPNTSTPLTYTPYFAIAREGAVYWYDQTAGKMQADGYVNMSGTFYTTLSPGTLEIHLFVYRKSDNATIAQHKIVSTSSTVAPFSLVLFVDNTMYFRFFAYQANSQPNGLRANIFFEAIN